MTHLPAGWKMFPGYLREAGYYCSNNAKEDYNLEKPPGTWDDSSRNGHWRTAAGGPAVLFGLQQRCHAREPDPQRPEQHLVTTRPRRACPAYHPDTPEVRRDWAQYYDNITTMDGQVQTRLDELEKDGLTNDTIILFYGDHGSGMPRSKRFPYNSGLQVCIVAVFPEKYRHLAPKDYRPGGKSERLLSFVDLAPTMLSLAGVRAPAFHQGQAFAGPYEAAPRTYSFGFRGRMDERYDLMRSVRDQRYSLHPQLQSAQDLRTASGLHVGDADHAVWDQLYREGKLKPPQTYFWETKPAEELTTCRPTATR